MAKLSKAFTESTSTKVSRKQSLEPKSDRRLQKAPVDVRDSVDLLGRAQLLGHQIPRALPRVVQAKKGGALSSEVTQTKGEVGGDQPARRHQPRTIVQRTEEVDVPRSQELVEDMPGGKKGGTKFAWQSRFAVDIDQDSVLVTIRIKSDIDPKMFHGIWAAQVEQQWSNRFMVKAAGKNYPIRVDLIQVDSGEHYAVTNKKTGSALKSGSRAHFGTENMTTWGENDTTNIAHEVGHMLGNVDEYGKVRYKDGREFDYNSQPSTSIMAVSKNNPISKHYYLIEWAAKREMVKLGILQSEDATSVIADPQSRLGGQSNSGGISMSELSGGLAGLKSSGKEASRSKMGSAPQEEESNAFVKSALSNLKPVKKTRSETAPMKEEASQGEKPVGKKEQVQEVGTATSHWDLPVDQRQYEEDMAFMLEWRKKGREKLALYEKKHSGKSYRAYSGTNLLRKIADWLDGNIELYKREAREGIQRRWPVYTQRDIVEQTMEQAILEEGL